MSLPGRDLDDVLIVGPAFSGRRRLFHRLLAARPGRPVLVSTRQPASRVRDAHRRTVDGDPAEPVVVDCVANAVGRAGDGGEATGYAQDPGNLTSIGTTFVDLAEDRDEDALAVGVTTVSPLLMYASASEVFQFLYVLAQRATGEEWPVAATIDPGAHDETTVEQFVPMFDGVVETRRRDDETREFRVQRPERTEWRPIEAV
jgi:hypothetical protein